ncbi:MAG: glycosyltransferase family 2 protein [Candidatus Omnitrophota bacterium]
MTYIFWFSVCVLIYTYLGYPLYVTIRARFFPNPVKKDTNFKPSVSVIISVYNESQSIKSKIDNLLSLDYPKEKIEILTGSDASTDSTNDILKHISDKKVSFFAFPSRRGKASVLNDLIGRANGEILVFCDARQIFDKCAISHLVANFTDKKVGCVSGELNFDHNPDDNGVSEGIGVYWDYEKLIRKNESAVHSMVGATGAIYAIRKELYNPLPKDTILDDVYIPLSIARLGYRCIWDYKAKAYDKPVSTPEMEYRRKVRTLAGNYQIFGVFKDMLIPFKNPVAVPFISHKLLRVLSPIFMISAFISNIFVRNNNFYSLILFAQIVFYILAVIGGITCKYKNKGILRKVSSTIYMFCLLNVTALAGLYRFLQRKQSIVWEK